MKTRILTLLFVAIINLSALMGCNRTRENTPAPMLSKEEAMQLALNHAGFTTEEVTFLQTEYEIDDGIPQYEISFRQDRFEYDYTISAETGTILAYDKDE